MSIEARLRRLEDRFALQDVLNTFCNAVDSLADMEGLLDCFTDEAIFDLTGIGLPQHRGREEIRRFFAQVFRDMSHHAHLSANFTVDELAGDRAKCRATVLGTGATHDGRQVLVYVRYFLEFAHGESGWRIGRLSESALMPLPDSLTGIHVRPAT